MEMEVGLIDQNGRMGRVVSDLDNLRACGHGARRAVGIGDGDDLGPRGDGGEETFEGKLQIVRGLHRDGARIGRRGVDLIHCVGRHGEQQFIACFEKGLEEHVNGFIHAIGQRHLRRGKTEMRGDNRFNGLTLGIARQTRRQRFGPTPRALWANRPRCSH